MPKKIIPYQAFILFALIFISVCLTACDNSQEDDGPDSIISVTGIEMIHISGGTFIMGSPPDEAGRDNDEGPRHQVKLSGFYIGKFEVTQEQYLAVMGINPSYFNGDSGREPVTGESQEKRPVERVTWYDTVEFCNKLSVLEGLQEIYTISERTPSTGHPIIEAEVTADFTKNGYRLPTEAEWEYACRAGTKTAFNNQNNDYTDAVLVGKVAWYSGNEGNNTHEVGLKTANNWGLYDMHGNVWELCWDWWNSGYYSNSPKNNPTGPDPSSGRILRGGHWGSYGYFLRSASRGGCDPSVRSNDIGFRLARK